MIIVMSIQTETCLITKFAPLKEKNSQRICEVEGGLTKFQSTARPDHVWPEVRTKIGKAAQHGEKQEWAKEKPKLDNARRLRGIYFIDPDDEEHKETLKHARRKLESPVAPVMPC